MPKTIGIISEGKRPADLRTPLTPQNCEDLMLHFPGTKVIVQPSPHRCYTDDEYRAKGITLSNDLNECDILLGVKEVPVEELIDGKTYLFFSHTMKKQPHNRNLLRSILNKRITLIDYETLTWEAGNRILGFGRFAGIVGTHYAFVMWGRKYGSYALKPANEVHDLQTMIDQYAELTLPPMRIVLCGDGRVAHGSIELLKKLKIHRVSPEEFLENEYDEAVYVQLRSEDYYIRKDGRPWDKADFYKHPEDYKSCFKPFYQLADVMINAVYWNNKIEPFFTREEMKGSDFRIKVISDITCDIPGPIPSTIRSTTIESPYYGYNVLLEKEVEPFAPNSVDVQAVGNLPCELPFDASIEFGEQLVRHVLPCLLMEDKENVILNATITSAGGLMPKFGYLAEFIA